MASANDQTEKFSCAETISANIIITSSTFNNNHGKEGEADGRFGMTGGSMENTRQATNLITENDEDQLLLENGKKCCIM